MSNGRIHVILNPELVRGILDLLDAIEQQLPFRQSLPPSEKKRLVKARAGTQKVLEGIAGLQRVAGMPPAVWPEYRARSPEYRATSPAHRAT